MTASAGQMAPTLRPVRRPGERAVDQRLKLALRLLLEAHHVGHENAATWEQLRSELAVREIAVSCVRRLQEAASELRRVDKVAIGGTSQSGIFVVGDDSERKLVAAERLKRIRAEVEELKAFDLAMYERIAGVLPMENAAP